MGQRKTKAAAYTSAVIYLRVSTDHQRMSGLGREAQEAACRAYASRQGWTAASVHVDDGLGGKLPIGERPGLAAAVAASQGPGVAFVVYSLSRAFRTQREAWATVEGDYGEPALPLVSATEPFDLTTAFGRAAFGMLTVISTFALPPLPTLPSLSSAGTNRSTASENLVDADNASPVPGMPDPFSPAFVS